MKSHNNFLLKKSIIIIIEFYKHKFIIYIKNNKTLTKKKKIKETK